ncbi:MAG: hypothetical protein GX639_17800 [Fibrobacter sp.]|mgnify:CR=1 FL=1|nr:hypothetical protein [Fibrobacter sp.]
MKLLKMRCVVPLFGLLLFSSTNISAEGVDIFGYAQITLTGNKDLADESVSPTTTFSVQEFDLFFQKTLSPKITMLADIQFNGNYSTSKSWGSMALDELWIKFSPYRQLNIKVGKLLPTFNSFNEIKTKFPLFPYIVRPIVYETSFQESLALNRWAPEHAMMQIFGTQPINNAKLDYAIFGGNSEFLETEVKGSGTLTLPGDDTTNFKLVGGRVGMRASGIKFGVSGTYDYARNDVINKSVADQNARIPSINEHLPSFVPKLEIMPKLGDIPRARLGFDLSYTGHGLTIEGEYILVKQMPSDKEKANLDIIVKGTTIPAGQMKPYAVQTVGTDLTKSFWYVNVMYDFLDKFYASAGFSNQADASDLLVSKDGVTGLLFCFGYRLTDNVTIKSEFTNIRNDIMSDEAAIELNQIIGQVAVSVFF